MMIGIHIIFAYYLKKKHFSLYFFISGTTAQKEKSKRYFHRNKVFQSAFRNFKSKNYF